MSAANKRFENKVVIITGAAGDIGRATVRRFATEGAKRRNRVAVASVTPRTEIDPTFDPRIERGRDRGRGREK